MLEGAVQRGTGRALRKLGASIGGKTGTTNEFRDAWFVGFTPDLVAAAYVGFDQPQSLGRKESGGRGRGAHRAGLLRRRVGRQAGRALPGSAGHPLRPGRARLRHAARPPPATT